MPKFVIVCFAGAVCMFLSLLLLLFAQFSTTYYFTYIQFVIKNIYFIQFFIFVCEFYFVSFFRLQHFFFPHFSCSAFNVNDVFFQLNWTRPYSLCRLTAFCVNSYYYIYLQFYTTRSHSVRCYVNILLFTDFSVKSNNKSLIDCYYLSSLNWMNLFHSSLEVSTQLNS